MFKGDDIRKRRKELKLSAKDLAALIDVEEANIYKWEKGHKPHDPEDFLKVQEWLSGKTETVTNSKNGAVVQNKPQHGGKSQNQGIDPAKEIERLNGRQITIEAKIDVLFDVAVELLSATSGESGTLIRKKLEKRVDELKKFAQ